MQMMHWYNPTTQLNEEVPAPMSDAQAIELLSGHPDSDEFIEEFRRWRATHSDVVRALILTGGAFYVEHQTDQSPN
jgi:surfactin synthase thioesterase subunit